mmetsp:Transcript_36188/g.108377  ORF Transcript_36188/g.108377 Transcript_36188/m.108377 type:complete len:88 (-) Transcript_36188:62-325(-)
MRELRFVLLLNFGRSFNVDMANFHHPLHIIIIEPPVERALHSKCSTIARKCGVEEDLITFHSYPSSQRSLETLQEVYLALNSGFLST